MKKVLLFALVFILAVSSCKNEPDEFVSTYMGNTAGNIGNSGIVAEEESYCYYSGYLNDDALYRASKDFKTTEKIADSNLGFSQLNVYGSHIYYTDGSPGALQRMSLEGKDRRLLTLRSVGNVHVGGDRVFYRASDFDDDWGKLYSCNLNGRKKKLLAKKAREFCVDGNTIYYVNMEDGNSLWAMDVSGNDKRKLVDEDVLGLNFDEKYIYYNEWESFNIFRMDKQTLQTECISKEQCEEINLAGDWIYYCNRSDEGALYRISKDGSVKEKLADGRAATINVAADTVFFVRMAQKAEDWGWYMLNLDERREIKLADR